MTREAVRSRVVVETRGSRGTEALARKLARKLSPPALLLLDGALGAGKTTFVRGFVRALQGGTGATVQSPTFALARSYDTRPVVHHLDLYRLDDSSALEPLGLNDLIDDEQAFVLVEWARDLVPDADAVRVRLDTDAADPNLRVVALELPARFDSLAAALAPRGVKRPRRARSA